VIDRDATNLTAYATAKAFRVPPWLLDSTYAPPRHPRLAWLLLLLAWKIERRVLKHRPTPADNKGRPGGDYPADHTTRVPKEGT
jgi:hypothetical protein